jgi:hypothetical protein
MKMQGNKPDLQQKSLKKHPFGVPEGYFEGFSTRLQQRIREEEASRIPERRMGSASRWLAMAAAILGAALLTTAILNFSGADKGANGLDPEMALFEQLEVFENDLYLYEYLAGESPELSDEEAFAAQAVEYLAMNDVELDLLFDE